MDNKLFDSILAMDSYNRGYNAGIKFGEELDNSDSAIDDETRLGDVTVVKSKGDSGAATDGFYAIAYQYVDSNSATQTVIAYRGTDNFLDTGSGASLVGGDIANAYALGGGSLEATQALDALKFYHDVAALSGVGTITLTGHSMGGGLAGMVSELTGKIGSKGSE